LANKEHIKIGNQIKIKQNGNENYNYINNVKNNIDVRSQRGKSKCISVETNSSLEDEKQWSQDKSQKFKKLQIKSGTKMDFFFFFKDCKIIKRKFTVFLKMVKTHTNLFKNRLVNDNRVHLF